MPLVEKSLVVACLAALCACTEPAPPQSGVVDDAATADTKAAETAAADVPTDTGPLTASCSGTAPPAGFAPYDKECNFLASCPGAGKCYCGKAKAGGGNSCPANKQLCNADLCQGVDTSCWCGEQCSGDKKKCPQFICAPLDIKTCEVQDDCAYVGSPPPASCGCTKMKPESPACWCGKCTSGQEKCPADLCTAKDPNKCIVVPGKAKTGCFCDTCGLLGTEPKCFYLLCP